MRRFSRGLDERALDGLLRRFPAVGILGPRQAGKTTLALSLRPNAVFDLERPSDLARLDNPELALAGLRGLVVIDEVQRRPELFPVLRHLIDREPSRRKFLILGSASPELLRQSSESLAGRIAYVELEGFRFEDVPGRFCPKAWLRGGLPRSLFAASDTASLQWREEYVRAFLERDIPALGITVSSRTLGRFWSMLAHLHGSIANLSELGRSFGVSDTAIRHYLEILERTFMVTLLKPWHENISKRQVKRPKLYFRDSGILHALLGIRTQGDLENHPKLGASWEGFALMAAVRKMRRPGREFHFWGTHSGAELDLLVVDGSRRQGFEFKWNEAPRWTPSMASAMGSLGLSGLSVVHPGSAHYQLAKSAHAVPLAKLLATRPS